MQKQVLEILTTVLTEYGFSAFLVVLTIGIVVWYSVFIINKMEKNHDAEIERLVTLRNILLDNLLRGERQSSEDMKPVIDKLEKEKEG